MSAERAPSSVEVDLGPALAEAVAGSTWQAVPSRGGQVWQIEAPDQPLRFLKLARTHDDSVRMAAEVERLRWLAGEVAALPFAAPRVLAYDAGDGIRPAALLTLGLPGTAQPGPFLGAAETAAFLGATLRRLHDAPLGSCPFEAALEDQVHRAEHGIAAGRVEPARLSPPLQRFEPGELLESIRRMPVEPPALDERVLVHGDWSVGNVLYDPTTGECSGVTGWSVCGLGDRYVDLGTGTRSVMGMFGAESAAVFLDGYGLAEVDSLRLDFHALLAELY